MASRLLKASLLTALSVRAEIAADDDASLLQRKILDAKKVRTASTICDEGLTLNLGDLAEGDNDLGGTGMVWRNVHPNIPDVDLHITVVENGGSGHPHPFNDGCPAGTPECRLGADYCPANPANNKMHGDFVQFSMMCGASPDVTAKTKLKFQLKQDGAAMALEHFTISVYDVDEGKDKVTGLRQGTETVRACGAQVVSLPVTDDSCWDHIAELNVVDYADGCSEVSSTTFGNKHNNPRSATLDGDQAKRTVDFIFDGVSEAELEFRLSHCQCGRNLLFAFAPAVSCSPLLPPTTTPAPDLPPVPLVNPEECRAIGDPHLKVFDNHRSIPMYDDGDFWMIKSDLLKVQARNWAKHWRGQASMRALAISGSLISDKVLIIDGPSEKVTLDGEIILPVGGPSGYGTAVPNGVEWHAERNLATAAANDNEVDTVFVHLAGGIIITVNIWQNGHIDAVIRMRPIAGMDGWCGNFDGDATDDTLDDLNQRHPALSTDDVERLFSTRRVDFIGCYNSDSENFDFAPGNDYTVEECATACHATNFFTRRNGGRCACGDSHKFEDLPINKVDRCNACQYDPDTWGTKNSIANTVDCVYSFRGPQNENSLTLEQCPNLFEARRHCTDTHSSEQHLIDDCVFDACFAPGTWDTEGPAVKFVGCYKKGTDNFMDYGGDHKTVNGCSLSCEGHHGFFAQRNGEQCYCGGSPDIGLLSGSNDCRRCHQNQEDFKTRTGLAEGVDCVYTYDLDLGPIGNSMCPEEFPFAYRPRKNFDHCCASAKDLNGDDNNNKEHMWERSNHCFGHQHHKCPNPPCQDFQPGQVVPVPPELDPPADVPNWQISDLVGKQIRFKSTTRHTNLWFHIGGASWDIRLWPGDFHVGSMWRIEHSPKCEGCYWIIPWSRHEGMMFHAGGDHRDLRMWKNTPDASAWEFQSCGNGGFLIKNFNKRHEGKFLHVRELPTAVEMAPLTDGCNTPGSVWEFEEVPERD